MYTLSYVLYVIGGIALLVLIGFVVALFGKKLSAKVSKIGIACAAVVAIGTIGYGGYHQYDTYQTIQAADSEFADNADKFTKLMKSTLTTTENVGNDVAEKWSKGIVDDPENFDVDKVVGAAILDNADDIETINGNLDKLKKYLNNMNDYDTGEYDYAAYKKAYNETDEFVKTVSDPNGTFSDFVKDSRKLDKSAYKAYKNIEVDE